MLSNKGLIFSAMSEVLSTAMNIYTNNQDRFTAHHLIMSGFAKWGFCISDIVGEDGDEFIRQYQRALHELNQDMADHDNFSRLIVNFIQHNGAWEGTATELHNTLIRYAREYNFSMTTPNFPVNAGALSSRLKKLNDFLLSQGITYQRSRGSARRSIHLSANQ